MRSPATRVVLLALLLGGCSLDRSAIGGDGGAVMDACTPTTEICNGLDDDCDGTVDEDFLLATDVRNCGTCGMACAAGPRGAPSCTGGRCGIVCDPSFADCDVDPGTGCEATLSDPTHCGSCTTSCAAPSPLCADDGMGSFHCVADCGALTICGASCVDTMTSTSHCGGCDMPCEVRPNTTATCVSGTCTYACAGGFDDCDSMTATGCETSTITLTDCGGCGAACGFPHAAASCPSGSCTQGVCDPGWADCVMTAARPGCETPTTTLTDCGGCGISCGPTFLHASATCATGTCGLGLCDPGWGDCDGTVPGCEADLTASTTRCGGCSATCTAGQSCSPYGCVAANAVVEVSAGLDFTCARIADGRVYCWGRDSAGQLGNGNPATDSTGAVQVSGITNAIDIDAGNAHACAVLATGAVVCWGENAQSQLGIGGTMDQTSPVTAMIGTSDARLVTAGLNHTCILRTGGTVSCWGQNTRGQLGDGTMTSNPMPVVAMGLSDAVDIAAGEAHTCAVRASGAMVCWGWNDKLQLGTGDGTDYRSPTAVVSMSDALRVSTYFKTTCALQRARTASCWGENGDRQLLDGSTTDRSSPVLLPLTDVAQIAAGTAHVCTRLGSGALSCWGANASGQLGDGTTMARTTPTAVLTITDAVDLTTGSWHACAVRRDGTVWCWGKALGNGAGADTSTPGTVTGLP